jgi:hypothetical protein
MALKLWLSAGAFVALTTHLVWINYADNEMKLGMIVYNNELQIKFEFHHY